MHSISSLFFILCFFLSRHVHGTRILLVRNNGTTGPYTMPIREDNHATKNEGNLTVENSSVQEREVKPKEISVAGEKWKVDASGNERNESSVNAIKTRESAITEAVRTKPFSLVPWHVPHKGDPDPGFHLDYAPPKIHPPSHN